MASQTHSLFMVFNPQHPLVFDNMVFLRDEGVRQLQNLEGNQICASVITIVKLYTLIKTTKMM